MCRATWRGSTLKQPWYVLTAASGVSQANGCHETTRHLTLHTPRLPSGRDHLQDVYNGRDHAERAHHA